MSTRVRAIAPPAISIGVAGLATSRRQTEAPARWTTIMTGSGAR